MKKSISVLTAILIVIFSVFTFNVSATDNLKLDFSVADADISMIDTGAFHYKWMVDSPNGAGTYHLAATNNTNAQVDFCISILPDKFTANLSDYKTLRISWCSSGEVGLSNVVEVAGAGDPVSFEFLIGEESFVADPNDYSLIGANGFTVTDLDISSLEGDLSLLNILPYYDDLNLNQYYFYIQSIELLTEESSDAIAPIVETEPPVDTEPVDTEDDTKPVDTQKPAESSDVTDKTTESSPETKPAASEENGGMPVWVIPVIIAAVVVAVVLIIVIVKKNKGNK